jgi:hypothetical protein
MCCTLPYPALQIRAQYDGTLWELLAKENEQKKARKSGQAKKVLEDALSAANATVQAIKQQVANGQALSNKMK